jgi:ligand-binding sensor domain-containing protein/signal transduction histidine kinase
MAWLCDTLAQAPENSYAVCHVIALPKINRRAPGRRYLPAAGGISCLFLISLGCVFSAFGQHYQVQNWHVEDGLPDGEITAIQQTPDGYLWIGTPKGLARFDGTRFKVFKANPNSALKDGRITWLLTSHDGSLWISTQDGSVVHRQNGTFESMHSPKALGAGQKETGAPGNWLWERRTHIIEDNASPEGDGALDGRNHLVEDSEGAIWWHVSESMLMRLKSGSWTTFTATNGLPAGGIRQLSVDHEGHVWVEALGKLHRYDNSGWDLNNEAVRLSGPWPLLSPANAGGLWVAESRGSWFVNGGEVCRSKDGQWCGTPLPIPLTPFTSRSAVTCLLEDHAGRIWFGTAAGGVFFSGANGAWERLKPQNPFSQGYISCLFEDSQGSIWVGTVGDGLYRVMPQPVAMLTLPPPFENAEINTTCVAHDGSVWVGMGGSAVLRWFDENKFIVFGTAQGLTNLQVCAILEDSHTNVWVGTSGRLFRLTNGAFASVNGPPELSKWVKVLFEDHHGRLWIGATGGVVCKENNQFTTYHLRPDREYCDVRSMAEDPSGDLWIGTIGDGLFRIRHDPRAKPEAIGEFTARDARSLYCDKDGTLWVGSWGEGLFRKQEDGAFAGYTTDDGLPSDRIHSVISDANGRLWLSTDNGLVGIAPRVIANYKRGSSPPLWCQHLSLPEGLANRGCSGAGQPVSGQTKDGRLWFPDYEGVAVLDSRIVAAATPAPTVLVETILADGNPLVPTEIGELNVSSSIRRFEFDYTAPDLASPQSLRFRYKLDGLDHDWVEANTQGVAYYSQLNPAQYQFRVMVGDSDGEWHGSNQVIRLRVVPRIWERRWVQVVASGLLVGILGGSVTWNQRRKLRLQVERLEMQQAVETERRRIARDLHDELGARLTATALHGELAAQGKKTPDEAKSEISLISRRVRQLIGAVDEIVWTTDPENDSLPNLAAFLCDYIEQFLAPTGIGCRLDVASDLPDLRLTAQIRRNLLLAVKEALNNSVRHAQARTIWLKIRVENNRLELAVVDDGHGFELKRAREGGKGLSNIRNRMEVVDGHAEIRSGSGAGTTVGLSVLLAGDRVQNGEKIKI